MPPAVRQYNTIPLSHECPNILVLANIGFQARLDPFLTQLESVRATRPIVVAPDARARASGIVAPSPSGILVGALGVVQP